MHGTAKCFCDRKCYLHTLESATVSSFAKFSMLDLVQSDKKCAEFQVNR